MIFSYIYFNYKWFIQNHLFIKSSIKMWQRSFWFTPLKLTTKVKRQRHGIFNLSFLIVRARIAFWYHVEFSQNGFKNRLLFVKVKFKWRENRWNKQTTAPMWRKFESMDSGAIALLIKVTRRYGEIWHRLWKVGKHLNEI